MEALWFLKFTRFSEHFSKYPVMDHLCTDSPNSVTTCDQLNILNILLCLALKVTWERRREKSVQKTVPWKLALCISSSKEVQGNDLYCNCIHHSWRNNSYNDGLKLCHSTFHSRKQLILLISSRFKSYLCR